MSDQEYNTTRRQVLAGLTGAGITGTAGCGGDPYSEDNQGDQNDTDPESDSREFESVDAFLETDDTDLLDLTQKQEHGLGFNVRIERQYEDGTTETTTLNPEEYEVTEAYTKRSNGEDFYGNLIYEEGKQAPDTAEEIEFRDQELRKLGFYNELDTETQINLEEEQGEIILDQESILAGQNELGLTVKLDEEVLAEYNELQTQELDQTSQIQARKTEEETIADYTPDRENSLEVWQKWRRRVADERLDRGAVNSDEFDTWHDVEEAVLENVSASPSNPQKFLAEATGEFNDQAGLAGEFPSKVNNYFQDIVMKNTEDMIAFDMPSQGEDASGVYVWGEDASEGALYAAASSRGQAATPPRESIIFAEGKLSNSTSPLKNAEQFPEWARVTVETIHEIGNGLSENSVDQEYAISVMDNFFNDEQSFPILEDNIQTAVMNLYAPGTSDAFTLTGEGTETEVETDLEEISGQPT